MAESERQTPWPHSFPPGMEGKLSDELHRISARVGTTVACLKAWHQMHETGFYFDDTLVPKDMRPLIDQLVKRTKEVLRDWKEIP